MDDPIASAQNAPVPVSQDEFSEAYGEPLERTLDLSTWRPGEDIADLYDRLAQEVADAMVQSDMVRDQLRREILPNIGSDSGSPTEAGFYQATLEQIERQHTGLLFSGHVEACDGTVASHDSLALSVTSIGVVLVSYDGDQGTWGHRLFRRDLRVSSSDPYRDTIDLLQKRRRRSGYDAEDRRDTLSELGRRGIMAYAERAVLLNKSDALWRMGHGNPAPYELLTGSGSMELLEQSLGLLKQLVDYQHWLFIPSAPSDRALLTIGDALRPLEYVVLDTAEAQMASIVDHGHYGEKWRQLASEFVNECGPHILRGVFRASRAAPPYIFYAHEECVHEAALLAIADSTLQEHRGFPLMLDLADTISRHTFQANAMMGLVRTAYADHDQPFRYLTERETR